MKKVLLGTSAIALASAFAAPASAAEWEVKVGGYMTQAIGYGDVDAEFDGDWDGVDVLSNTEVFFLPSITLDNGLMFGANIQLEGNTSSDQIDESYMIIKGSFGEINIGSENSAGYKMSYGPPSVMKVPVNSGSMSSWIPFSVGGDDVFRGTLGSTFLENDANNDSQRITYYTPRLYGFQLGGSYAHDPEQDSSGPIDTDSTTHDFFDVGANYVQSFGDFNVALSGRWGIASNNDGSDPEVWYVGGQLGGYGFTVGGGYGEQNKAGNKNGEVWAVGASYETGPWGFSVEYIKGKNVDDDMPDSNETLEQVGVGLNYALAKGVTVFGFGAWADFDGYGSEDLAECDCDEPNIETFDASVDGFVIGTGVSLSW
jgi:predicted porin